MNKFLQRYNTYVILGFVLLPVFLWIVSYLINFFAPANLNFPSPSVIGKTFIELLSNSTALTALLQTFKQIFLSVFLSLVLRCHNEYEEALSKNLDKLLK